MRQTVRMVHSSFEAPPSLIDHRMSVTAGDGAIEVTASGAGMLVAVDVQLFNDRSPARVGRWLTEAAVEALAYAAAGTRQRVIDSPDVPEDLKRLVLYAPDPSWVDAAEIPSGPFVATKGHVTATAGPGRQLADIRVEQIGDPEDLAKDVISAVNAALAASVPGPNADDLERAVEQRIVSLDRAFDRLGDRLDDLNSRLSAIDGAL